MHSVSNVACPLTSKRMRERTSRPTSIDHWIWPFLIGFLWSAVPQTLEWDRLGRNKKQKDARKRTRTLPGIKIVSYRTKCETKRFEGEFPEILSYYLGEKVRKTLFTRPVFKMRSQTSKESIFPEHDKIAICDEKYLCCKQASPFWFFFIHMYRVSMNLSLLSSRLQKSRC